MTNGQKLWDVTYLRQRSAVVNVQVTSANSRSSGRVGVSNANGSSGFESA